MMNARLVAPSQPFSPGDLVFVVDASRHRGLGKLHSLVLFRKPLIPYPNASDDDNVDSGEWLVKEAALIISVIKARAIDHFIQYFVVTSSGNVGWVSHNSDMSADIQQEPS